MNHGDNFDGDDDDNDGDENDWGWWCLGTRNHDDDDGDGDDDEDDDDDVFDELGKLSMIKRYLSHGWTNNWYDTYMHTCI
jgi:hypothetical protein